MNNYLNIRVKKHRDYLHSGTPNQRLFVYLEIKPDSSIKLGKNKVFISFVIDTSGSMREIAAIDDKSKVRTFIKNGKAVKVFISGKSKSDLVIESLFNIINSGFLIDNEYLSLIKFSDDAEVLVPFTNVSDLEKLKSAILKFKECVGGTAIDKGLEKALELFNEVQGEGVNHIVLLTDGQTPDEESVLNVAKKIASLNIPITAIGVGEEWNEELLSKIVDITRGNLIYVVPDTEQAIPPAINASHLPSVFLEEFSKVSETAITNLSLKLSPSKGISIKNISRVYPIMSEVNFDSEFINLGNLESDQKQVYIIELNLDEPINEEGKLSILSLELSYEIPSLKIKDKIGPTSIDIELTLNKEKTLEVDKEVMKWVQQRNLEIAIKQAIAKSKDNPIQAYEELKSALESAKRLENESLVNIIQNALKELEASKAISATTTKTLRVGAKTQVGDSTVSLSDEEIRKILGQ